MRVLLVEDNPPTQELLVRSLSDEGIIVTTATGVSTGMRAATVATFDAIVLDLMLPDGDGLDLCRALRANGLTTPILCLSARGDVSDRVRGLDAGADDYMRKPFALAELRARMRSLVRRSRAAGSRTLEVGALLIDFAARRLTQAGVEVPLTAREWLVLEMLAMRAGSVVGRAELLEQGWGKQTPGALDSLEVILGRLRRKLAGPGERCPIRTVRGEGLIFEVEA
jgi:DNA-binding response OmpR family regulator